MTRKHLFEHIVSKQSYLCVGLDSDIHLIPKHLLKEEDPIFEFNRQIIDATAEYCVAYKPNTAFYEAMGVKGWQTLQRTVEYIPGNMLTIADAKRGDIGNTASLYARAFFSEMDFDAITIAPYMGEDSVKPFLEFENKWVILLALTSNPGSADFQMQQLADGEYLFERVLQKSQAWASADRMMYVVGATQDGLISRVRNLAPDHFLLVPGIGAQGGNLEAVSQWGMNKQCGLLVNSSRGIQYASSGEDFAEAARKAAKAMQEEMTIYLDKYLG